MIWCAAIGPRATAATLHAALGAEQCAGSERESARARPAYARCAVCAAATHVCHRRNTRKCEIGRIQLATNGGPKQDGTAYRWRTASVTDSHCRSAAAPNTCAYRSSVHTAHIRSLTATQACTFGRLLTCVERHHTGVVQARHPPPPLTHHSLAPNHTRKHTRFDVLCHTLTPHAPCVLLQSRAVQHTHCFVPSAQVPAQRHKLCPQRPALAQGVVAANQQLQVRFGVLQAQRALS